MTAIFEQQSRAATRRFAFTALGTGALALACVAGCASAPDGAKEALGSTSEEVTAPPSAGDVLGFESLSGWTPQSGTKSLSTDRSRGASAFALNGLSGYVNLVSARLGSQALPSLGVGSQLSLDVKLPSPPPNQGWNGAIQLYLSVPSKALNNVYLGQVELTPLAKNKYVTLHFNVPQSAGSVLAGATYDDLTFTIALNVPTGVNGTYRVDNLRVRGAFPTGGAAQARAGESIPLKAWKGSGTDNHVDDVTFDEAIVQIPKSFHVSEGNAGSGALKLEYQRPGGTLTACNYVGDSATSGKYYTLGSCTSGLVAGDLVLANRLKLTVTSGGNVGPRTKVRAQIAKNPLDDELGSIAPIPTFFGDTPAESSEILKAYSTAQKTWPLTNAKLIHVPTPEITYQSATSIGHPLPPVVPGHADPPFHFEHSVLGNDYLDVRWSLDGALDVSRDSDTQRTNTIRNDLDVRYMFLGSNNPLVTFNSNATAVFTKQPSGDFSASAHYDFCPKFVGYSVGCSSGDTTVTVPIEVASYHDDWPLLEVNYWFYRIGGTGHLDASLTAQVELVPDGFGLNLTPAVDSGIGLSAAVAVGGFGGGGIDGNVDLIHLAAPSKLFLTSVEDLSPRACKLDNSMGFQLGATFGTSGGSIKYYLEGGLTCGYWDQLCWRTEGDLIEKIPHKEGTLGPWGVGDIGDIADIPLPSALCPTGITLEQTSPDGGEQFGPGQVVTLVFSGTRLGPGGTIESIPCNEDNVHITTAVAGDVVDAADPDAIPGEDCVRHVTLDNTGGDHSFTVLMTDDLGTSLPSTRTVELIVPRAGEPPLVNVDPHLWKGCPPTGSSPNVLLTGTYAAGYPVHTQWYLGNTAVVGGADTPTYVANTSGIYRYVVTSASEKTLFASATAELIRTCPR